MESQWNELREHCKDTPDPEHKILERMLHQSYCAIDDCDDPAISYATHTRLRYVFDHEKSAHGSTDMSNICSYVRLAREGRIRAGPARQPEPNCERLAFERMLEKVMALPDTTKDMLFERSGYHNPAQKTAANMGKILPADPLAQEWERPPYWWPVRADYFLKLIRPNPSNPADHEWTRIWTRLREEYANGRI